MSAWFASTNPGDDGEALEPMLPASVEDVSVTLLRKVIDQLRRDVQGKAELLDDAVVCLHEAGDHENADRIERLAAPF